MYSTAPADWAKFSFSNTVSVLMALHDDDDDDDDEYYVAAAN